jgi:GGDEF domain-containing protein
MERMRSCLAGSVLISQKGISMSFAHDGLNDQLTRLAAPPHYYEILRREIALANRNLTELTAIRLVLTSITPLYDATLISFADLITNSFRYEDAKARLGENEFALLIRGDLTLATQLSRRLVAQWAIEGTPDSSISYACAKYSFKELAIDFINRLDDEALTVSDF